MFTTIAKCLPYFSSIIHGKYLTIPTEQTIGAIILIKYRVCKPGPGWKEMGAPVLRPLLTGLLAGLIFSSCFLAGLLRLIRSDQLAWSGLIRLAGRLARSDHLAGSGQLASSGRLG